MAPVALVERRVAQHRVGPQVGVGVGAQGVADGGVHGGAGAEREAQGGERGEVGRAVLGVQLLVGARVDGPQQGAGAAGGVEDGAGGSGEVGHQAGEFGGGERVLARVGVEVTADQELEGPARAEFGGQVGHAAQQRHRGQQARGGGGPQGRSYGGPGGEHLLQRLRQQGGEAFVAARAHLQPDRRAGVDDQQDAAGVDESGDRALRVAGELLPDAFAQRDLGELALAAQPVLDLGEGEGGADLAAAHGLGEVGVPAAPVADGGTADAREPCDSGRGHLCRVVLHSPRSPRRPCRPVTAEHTDAHKTDPFTHVYGTCGVNRVDSVHSTCCH